MRGEYSWGDGGKVRRSSEAGVSKGCEEAENTGRQVTWNPARPKESAAFYSE